MRCGGDIVIPVFYLPELSCDTNSYSPSAGKPALVMKDWLSDPTLPRSLRSSRLSLPANESCKLSTQRSTLTGCWTPPSLTGLATEAKPSQTASDTPLAVSSGRYRWNRLVRHHECSLLGGIRSSHQIAWAFRVNLVAARLSPRGGLTSAVTSEWQNEF